MRLSVVAGILLTCVLMPSVASTQGIPDDSPAALAEAFIESLSLATSARETLQSAQSAGDPVEGAFEALVAEQTAVARLREASRLFLPFKNSQRDKVRSAAAEASESYEIVAEVLSRGAPIWQKFAKTKSEDDLVALLPESAKHAALVQEAWRLLPLSVAALTHALVDDKRMVDGKIRYLLISRADRQGLLQSLKVKFPNVIAGQKGGQVLDVCVNLFRGFLTGGWKTSDEA